MHRRSLLLGAAGVLVAPEFETFDLLPFIPLGDYRQSAAWHDNVTGILKGPSVVFWNVSKG